VEFQLKLFTDFFYRVSVLFTVHSGHVIERQPAPNRACACLHRGTATLKLELNENGKIKSTMK